MKKHIFTLIFAFLSLMAFSQQQDKTAPKFDVTRPNAKTTAQMNSMTRMVEGSEVWNIDTQTEWRFVSGSWTNQGVGGGTGGTETDPIFSGSDAASVTSLGLANAATAFGWGDHSSFNYASKSSLNIFTGDNDFRNSTTFRAENNAVDNNITFKGADNLVRFLIDYNGDSSGFTELRMTSDDIFYKNISLTGSGSIGDSTNNTSSPYEGKIVFTQEEFDVFIETTEYNEFRTYYIIRIGDSGAFLEPQINASGSLNAYSSPILIAATTETLESGDALDDGQYYLKGVEGDYTKTFTRSNTGISKIMTYAPTGYVRLDNDDALKIGNLDRSISQSHTKAMLVRLDPLQLAGYPGELELLTSSDGNYKIRLVGDGGAFAERRKPSVRRGGRSGGNSVELVENIPIENAWGGNSPGVGIYETSGLQSAEWVWIITIGKSSSDLVTNERTFLYNGGSTSFQSNNAQSILAATHGHNTIGSLFYRKQNNPQYDENDTGDGIFPVNLSGIDFTISASSNTTSKTVDVARYIYLERALSLREITLITEGAHPEQFADLLPNEFVYDLGSLPTGVTISSGTPEFNPDETSPLAHGYYGTNENPISLTFSNKRVQ